MSGEAEGRWALLACASACFGLFVWLAITISSGAVGSSDEAIRSVINRFASPDLTRLARGASLLGSGAVIAALSVIAFVGFYATGRRRAAIALAVVMAGAVVLENALKFALHRARPEPFFGTAPETYSFPSGHALFSVLRGSCLASQRGIPKLRSTRGHLGDIAGLDCSDRTLSHLSRRSLPDRCNRGISCSCLLDNGAACIAGRSQR